MTIAEFSSPATATYRGADRGMDFDDKTFVLGVGAQKAGTTWLHSYLSQRGDIFMPKRKELHYFDAKYRPELCGAHRLNALAKKRWRTQKSAYGDSGSVHDDQGYSNYFRRNVPRAINMFGEITPTYALIGETGYKKVRELFRNVRIIFIMRDPVERYNSQIRMFKKVYNREAPKTDLWNQRSTELSSYENTIRALETVFKRHEIVYLFYETLFRDETIRELCKSLGVGYRDAEFQVVVNSTGPGESIPPDEHQRLLAKFEPTYAFCRKKFGAAVPAEWHI